MRSGWGEQTTCRQWELNAQFLVSLLRNFDTQKTVQDSGTDANCFMLHMPALHLSK